MANEIEKRNEAFLIYQDENGIARVNVRFEGEDVWLSVEQIMELFDASQQDVSYHIKQIYADGEQDAERTHKKFLLVRQEGNRSVRRNMSHYNLDMIIAALCWHTNDWLAKGQRYASKRFGREIMTTCEPFRYFRLPFTHLCGQFFLCDAFLLKQGINAVSNLKREIELGTGLI